MAVYPLAAWMPVPSHSGLRPGHLGWVQHCQVGLGSCYAEFDIPANSASSHFWIGQDGTVQQYVDTDYIAWAEMAGNGYYISCEFEGNITDPLTPQQIAAGAALILWCSRVDSFPLVACDHGETGVTTHCFNRPPDYPADPAWGDHSCPGPGPRLAQHAELIAAAVALTEPPEDDDMPTSMYGQVPTNGTPVVIAIPPPSGGGANWGPAWFSMGCDFANATVRVAVHNGTSWRLIQSITLTPAGGRVGFALQAGDDKISLGMQAPLPGGTTGWLIEYGQAVAA